MAFNKSSKNGYVVGKTADVVATTNTSMVSRDTSTEDLSNKKIMIGIDMVVAMSDAAADLEIWASPDGTNWAVVAANVIADIVHTAGVQVAQADLSSVTAPYYKITFNAAGAAVGTSGRIKFIYAVKE